MAGSQLVRQAIYEYLKSGKAAGTGNFEKYGTGPFAAGFNPTAQFVGGFEYTISKSNGDLNIRVTNYTSLNSAAYHSVPSIPPVAEFPQPFARVPLTTVVQDFDLVIPCN